MTQRDGNIVVTIMLVIMATRFLLYGFLDVAAYLALAVVGLVLIATTPKEKP